MSSMMARVGIERRPLRVADAALALWIAMLAVVTVYGAATTTGFLTVSNMKAILTAASFVGIIAVGLTVIVLSGNLFSLALGQTAAISAMVFLYTLRLGLVAAILLTLLLGLAIGAVQGFVVGAWGANPIIVVASKSHFTQNTSDYLAQAAPGCGYEAVGSSLKFCIVAEGRADLYPRLSPTSEWDTAAGHAVLLGAGGRVVGPDGKPLRYGKPAFLNRAFVATGGWDAPECGPFLEDFAGGRDLPEGV